MTCWVRSATRTACSVGRASASSKEFVCRLWVPPSAAAMAWSVTRTTLLSGCWAVSVQPAVCVWKRRLMALGFAAPKRSFMSLAHSRRAARNLAISSRKLEWQPKKKESRAPNLSTSRPMSTAAFTYSRPSAIVKATSWIASQPASRMW